MKKLNLLITLLICITASAQFNKSFGIKAGVNYSKYIPDFDVYGVEVVDFQWKVGYYVGGFFNLGISDRASIRPELVLSNQGTKTSQEIYIESNNDAFVPGVLEVVTNWNEMALLLPISFRYELVEHLFLEVGAQAGYAVKRTEVLKKYSLDPSQAGQKYTHSDFDRFDVALNGGLGVDLTDQLELQCRYSYGVIERDNYYKTSVVSVGFGFKL